MVGGVEPDMGLFSGSTAKAVETLSGIRHCLGVCNPFDGPISVVQSHNQGGGPPAAVGIAPAADPAQHVNCPRRRLAEGPKVAVGNALAGPPAQIRICGSPGGVIPGVIPRGHAARNPVSRDPEIAGVNALATVVPAW